MDTMNAPAQTVVLASESLTQKQEDFARYFVETRNASAAYRMAYNVGPTTLPATVWQEASRTLAHPLVAARVQELRDAAEAHTLVALRELVQDWVDIATADANEIVRVETHNCRHCYGVGGRYQWVDEEELLDAVQLKQDDIDRGVKHVKMPEVRGGFGYMVQRAPNPACVKCAGAGVSVVKVTDTDTLRGKARKLYKGAKQTSQGLEVLMHDPRAAAIELAKILGAYGKDVQLNPAAAAQPVPADATEAEAAQGYMEMLGAP